MVTAGARFAKAMASAREAPAPRARAHSDKKLSPAPTMSMGGGTGTAGAQSRAWPVSYTHLDALGLGGERAVQRDHVALLQQLFQAYPAWGI